MMRRTNSNLPRESFLLPYLTLPSKTIVKSRKVNDVILQNPELSKQTTTLSSYFFPDLPEHYPLRKKLSITKSNSITGTVWDFLQLILSLLACGIYVADTYGTPYHDVKYFNIFEIIITQFFLIDFLFNWYLVGTYSFLYRPMSIVDILTILPVYITLATEAKAARLGFLRFARILRLTRIFRTFKAIRKISGVKKQILTLSLTFLSMSFLAAGILISSIIFLYSPVSPLIYSLGLVQLVESDLSQYSYHCKYINEHTDWEPSCSPNTPADNSCDCIDHNCMAWYQPGDKNHEPSLIRCIGITFFDAFYFIIVTTATVGYGDIHPTNS